MTSAISSRIALCAAAAWLILPAAAFAQAWPNQGGQTPGQFPSAAPAQPAPAASSGGWPSPPPPHREAAPGLLQARPRRSRAADSRQPRSRAWAVVRRPGQAKCAHEVPPLRDEVQSKGNAIKAVTDRKGTREETCGAFKNFVAAEVEILQVSAGQQGCLRRAGRSHQGDEGESQPAHHAAQPRLQRSRRRRTARAEPERRARHLAPARIRPRCNDRSKGTTFDTLTGNPLAR